MAEILENPLAIGSEKVDEVTTDFMTKAVCGQLWLSDSPDSRCCEKLDIIAPSHCSKDASRVGLMMV